MQLVSCGLLILRNVDCRQFLLLRHPDRWDLPKGHVDPGESELNCALRETEEETGLRRAWLEVDPAFRYEARYRVPWRESETGFADKTLVVFLARLLDEYRDRPVQLTEHQDYDWFPWSPPHRIQEQTIDPLLRYAEPFLGSGGRPPRAPASTG